MKRFWLLFITIITISALVFTACGDDNGDDNNNNNNNDNNNNVNCGGNHELVDKVDNVDMAPDPDTGEMVALTASGLVQTWRECKHCGDKTYPTLPGGVQPPAGAVWLGLWEEDQAQQIKYTLSDDIKAKVQSGEFNRVYLYVDKSKIQLDQGSSKDGRYLSTVAMVVNAPKTVDGVNTWQSQRAWNYETRTQIPSTVRNLNDISVPLYSLINHTPHHEDISWNGFIQFYVQHTSSGGLIYNLNPIAMFVGPGLSDDPPPPPPVVPDVPVNISVSVDGTAQDNISVTGRNGSVTELTGKNGFQFGGKTAGHRSAYAFFAVDLDSRTLSDFKEIKFKFDGSGDSQRLALVANTSAFTGSLGTHITGGSSPAAGYPNGGSGNGYLAAGQVTLPVATVTKGTEQTVTLEIVQTVADFGTDAGDSFVDAQATSALNATGTVYLTIYEHTGNDAVIMISDIELVLR